MQRVGCYVCTYLFTPLRLIYLNDCAGDQICSLDPRVILSSLTHHATVHFTKHANIITTTIELRREYSVDRNCRNLALGKAQEGIRLSWRAVGENQRLSERAEGLVRRVRRGSVRPSIVSDAFDFSSSHLLEHFPPWISFLLPPLTKPSCFSSPCSAHREKRETSASARQTCAKLRCRNSSMERSRRDAVKLYSLHR